MLKVLTDTELVFLWNQTSSFITDLELIKDFASEFTLRNIDIFLLDVLPAPEAWPVLEE